MSTNSVSESCFTPLPPPLDANLCHLLHRLLWSHSALTRECWGRGMHKICWTVDSRTSMWLNEAIFWGTWMDRLCHNPELGQLGWSPGHYASGWAECMEDQTDSLLSCIIQIWSMTMRSEQQPMTSLGLIFWMDLVWCRPAGYVTSLAPAFNPAHLSSSCTSTD